MKGLTIAPALGLDRWTEYSAPGCRPSGEVRGAMAPLGDFPLWALRGHFGPGGSLGWEGDHGDQALYALEGELRIGDRVCPEGGVVIIESGAPNQVDAPAGAEILHFGAHPGRVPSGQVGSQSLLGPPDPSGHGVHVIGPGALYAAHEPGRDTRVFADGTCERCRLFLHFTARDHEYASSRHSHSADEIIWMLRGEIRLGNRTVRPGQALAIAANRQYAFRSGPSGFAFLNYRADASEQTIAGCPPLLEGGRALGLAFVGDVVA